MKNLSIMIKPASSACNLRCQYCFYADLAGLREQASFGRMPEETVDKMLANIRRDLVPGDRITFSFQGGEPTLTGLGWFQDFTAKVALWQDIHVDYALQTNGTLLDEKWCEFFAGHHFLVGLSLDILPDCHDFARGEGTYGQVLNAMALLKQHKVEFNVLCTLTNYVARHPGKVWKQLENLGIDFVQFIPCLDELESPGKSPFALTPKRFASFYTQLFPLWLGAFRRGQYRSVKLFDDLVNQIAFGAVTACGIDGRCRAQMVVEADGSVYPCDFYCLDAYKVGNLADQSLRAVYESPVNGEFVNRERTFPKICEACPFGRLCGGSCQRMTDCLCEENFCGYQSFLREAMPALQAIAREQRAMRGL